MSHKNRELYSYKFKGGKQVSRLKLIEIVLNTINGREIDCKTLAEELEMEYQSTSSILRSMVAHGHLESYKTQRYTIYKVPKKCLLAEMFYNPTEILKGFKMKKKKTYQMEDFPNISHPQSNRYNSNCESSSANITNMYDGD